MISMIGVSLVSSSSSKIESFDRMRPGVSLGRRCRIKYTPSPASIRNNVGTSTDTTITKLVLMDFEELVGRVLSKMEYLKA